MPRPDNRCQACHTPVRGSQLRFTRVSAESEPRRYQCEICTRAGDPLTTNKSLALLEAEIDPAMGEDLHEGI